jgi:hypothetical protein
VTLSAFAKHDEGESLHRIMFGENSSTNLLWDVSAGRLFMTIKSSTPEGGVQARYCLNAAFISVLAKGLGKIRKASPGSTYPIIVATRDPQSKERRYGRGFVLTAVKDEKRRYCIDLDIGEGKMRFAFSRAKQDAPGASLVSSAEWSALPMAAFQYWIEAVAPLVMVRAKVRYSSRTWP